MRPIPILLAALFAVACGSTAQVVTSPTPVASAPETLAPTSSTAVLTLPPSTAPTPVGSKTPIPLSTPTPVGLDTPVPTGTAAATPAPTSDATTTPGGAPFGPFTKLDSFPASDAFEVSDVSVTPGGFIAVGFGGLNGDDYYGLRQGIVWTSVDGQSWIESVDPSLVNVTPAYVVSKGSDLFMAGDLATCSPLAENCTDVPQAGNGIWKSTNGGAWQLLPQAPDMQHGYIDNMFLAGDRLVVFGGAGEDEATTVWMSQDGATWTSTTDLGGMDPVTSMAVGPSGFSAFGTIFDDAAFDVVIVATTSTDGVHFTPATTPVMNGSGIDALAAGPGGMAGVGYHTSPAFDIDGVAVHSTDGVNWTQGTNSDGSFAKSGLQTIHALVGGGYVSLGYTPRNDELSLEDGDAWFSPDGIDWKLIARLDGAFSTLNTSELGPTGVVVFAAEQVNVSNDDTGSIVHAWFAPLASLHG
jgi:hypothetical protein